MSDQRKRGTIYCKQRAPITFKSTSEHVDDARETDSFMCSAITKRSCKRGHTRSVGARDTVRAVRGRRAWSCEAHLRTYAPSLASICFRQRVARSSLLDDPLKWRSAARYTCATFLGLFSRICTVGGYEVGIAQECLVHLMLQDYWIDPRRFDPNHVHEEGDPDCYRPEYRALVDIVLKSRLRCYATWIR